MKYFKLFCYLVFIGLLFLVPDFARADSPLWANMVSPKYRNAIYPTMAKPEQIKIRIKIDLSQNALSQSSLNVTLARDGKSLKTWNFKNLQTQQIINLPVGDISFQNTRSGPYVKDDDPYHFTLQLTNGSNTLDSEILELNKYPAPPAGVNEVRIDDNDNVLINGSPIFLFGSYVADDLANSNTWNQFQQWGFNAVRKSLSGNQPLWVFTGCELTDESAVRDRVQGYRQEPKTVAYYIADEPISSSHIPSSTLRTVYNAVKEEDPYHPAGWVDVTSTSEGDRQEDWSGYGGTSDFIMIDTYPCFTHVTWLGNIANNFEQLHDPSLGVVDNFEFVDVPTWGVPQIFQSSTWRWPNTQEERNMVYQYVTLGSKSLFPYKYEGDNLYLWDYYGNTLVPELKSIEAALFASRKAGTGVVYPENHISVSSSDPDILVWSYRITDEKEYLFLINPSSKWNKSLSSVPAPSDRTISVDITFYNPGSNQVEALIKDDGTPQTYNLNGGRLSLKLGGVNDTSSGVLVLSRTRQGFNPEAPSSPQGLRLQD